MDRRLKQLVTGIGRLVLVGFVLPATSDLASAQQSAPPRTPTASDPAPPAVAGDGGGLTPFSDRGLTPFGDRQFESFGRRGLESFSDIPLAPMGGLVVPGPSARRPERARNGRSLARAPRLLGPVSGPGSADFAANTSSVASIRGVTLPPNVGAPVVVLPPVALPALTLDPRPALATLEQSLHGELARARRRGDADLVRTLAANLQR